jgi:CheY-like chemotaxis protein
MKHTGTTLGKFVLYAEDDEDDRALLNEMMKLTDESIALVSVHNGEEILKFLDQLPPDGPLPCFILLDINMPVMNGYQTISKIKASTRYSSIPVILYSTASASTEKARAIQAGATEYISKPFSVNLMKEICQSFVRICNSGPQLYK